MKLTYGKANAKLEQLEIAMKRKVGTWSVLSGKTCSHATECKSWVKVGKDGKKTIQDGKLTKFRCFSASQEVMYPSVYLSRERNTEIIKLAATSVTKAAQALLDCLPKKYGVVRIHVGGDFQTLAYFDTWLKVAKARPDVIFYAYTKALPFWIKRLKQIPENLVMTASYGGRCDDLIEKHGLRYAKVVFSESEAEELGLEIDHDDSHAARPELAEQSFALLLHGTQPKGSEASQAIKDMKKQGTKFSYPNKKKGKK